MPMSEVIQHLRGKVLTDAELLADYISRRDEAAFAVLVRRHGPMVWGVCRRLLSHHDAEDAFQATFLVFVRKAASITSRELLASWLYGVARQTALKARANLAKRKERAEMPEVPVTEPDAQVAGLDEELCRLPEKYRAVIVLCELQGHTRKEAARQLGCPEGTVAGRLARAKAMLAKRLGRHDVMSAVPQVPAAVVSSTIKAVAGGQAAVSAEVAALAEGVLKTMSLSKLKKAAVALLVVFSLLAGAAVMSRTTAGEQPDRAALEKEAKGRPRWEYKALSHDEIKAIEFKKRGMDSVEGGLNMLGDEGWDLVAIEPPVRGPASPFGDRPSLYVFKRQKR
jgi:RNA polymerase sigma factor (sigma-70 family)